MHGKSQLFFNILKLKPKDCLGPANWIQISVLTEFIFNFILYFQLPIKEKKVANSSKQSSRRVSSVVGDYWNPWWTNNQLFHNMHIEIALQEEKIEIELDWSQKIQSNTWPCHKCAPFCQILCGLIFIFV